MITDDFWGHRDRCIHPHAQQEKAKDNRQWAEKGKRGQHDITQPILGRPKDVCCSFKERPRNTSPVWMRIPISTHLH